MPDLTDSELDVIEQRFKPDHLYRCMVCRREMELYRETQTHRHYCCPGPCGDHTDRFLRKGEPQIIALVDEVRRRRATLKGSINAE